MRVVVLRQRFTHVRFAGHTIHSTQNEPLNLQQVVRRSRLADLGERPCLADGIGGRKAASVRPGDRRDHLAAPLLVGDDISANPPLFIQAAELDPLSSSSQLTTA